MLMSLVKHINSLLWPPKFAGQFLSTWQQTGTGPPCLGKLTWSIIDIFCLFWRNHTRTAFKSLSAGSPAHLRPLPPLSRGEVLQLIPAGCSKERCHLTLPFPDGPDPAPLPPPAPPGPGRQGAAALRPARPGAVPGSPLAPGLPRLLCSYPRSLLQCP